MSPSSASVRLRVFVQIAAISAAVLGSGALGCGGGRSFDAGVFRQGEHIAFRVPEPPASWRRLEMAQASLAFRDDAAGASVLVNAQCKRADDDTPLAALTNHLLIGTTERQLESQTVAPFDGREALQPKVRAKLDGVPFAFDIFVLKKDGCIYDFVLVAPEESAEASRPTFEGWVRGFRTLPGAGVL